MRNKNRKFDKCSEKSHDPKPKPDPKHVKHMYMPVPRPLCHKINDYVNA